MKAALGGKLDRRGARAARGAAGECSGARDVRPRRRGRRPSARATSRSWSRACASAAVARVARAQARSHGAAPHQQHRRSHEPGAVRAARSRCTRSTPTAAGRAAPSACGARGAGRRSPRSTASRAHSTPEVLVIADRERPGGARRRDGRRRQRGDRGHDHDPARVRVVPSAARAPRRASLALATEASKRYERGVDPGIGMPAAARFLDAASASSARELKLGARGDHRSRRVGSRVHCSCAPPRCERLIAGCRSAPAAAPTCWSRSSSASQRGGHRSRVTVPTWRLDVDARGRPRRGGRALDRLRQDPRGAARDRGRVRDACTARARAAARVARRCSRSASTRRGRSLAGVRERGGFDGDDCSATMRAEHRAARQSHGRESEVLRPNLVAGPAARRARSTCARGATRRAAVRGGHRVHRPRRTAAARDD